MGLPEHLKEVTLADVPDSLSHYGVKGQKWGVRKKQNGKLKPRATMGLRDRAEQKWVDGGHEKSYNRVYRRAARKIRRGTRQLNRDPKFKGQNFRRDSALRREYYGAYSKLVTDQLNAAAARKGYSPRRRFQMQFSFDVAKDATPKVTIRRTDGLIGRMDQRKTANEVRKLPDPRKAAPEVKHAEADEPDEIEVKLTFDDSGYILDMDLPDMEHEELEGEDFFEHYDFDQEDFYHAFGEEDLEDFLMHFGVKGMRWGVRKRSSSGKVTVTDSSTGKSAQITYNPRKTTVNASTGEISTTSKKELKAINSQVKRNQLKLMSDDELKGRINRLKMEQEYKKLTAAQESPGKQMVKKILADTGKELAKDLVGKVLVPGIENKVGSLSNQAKILREAQKAANMARSAPVKKPLAITTGR